MKAFLVSAAKQINRAISVRVPHAAGVRITHHVVP